MSPTRARRRAQPRPIELAALTPPATLEVRVVHAEEDDPAAADFAVSFLARLLRRAAQR